MGHLNLKPMWFGSCDPNYYRDQILIWPFLFGLAIGFDRVGGNPKVGLAFLGLAIVCLILAKDWLMLAVGVLGLMTLQGWLRVGMGSSHLLYITLLMTAVLLVCLWSLRKRGFRYEIPRRLGVFDFLIGASAIIGTAFLFIRLT
jgi:hypothetical protein